MGARLDVTGWLWKTQRLPQVKERASVGGDDVGDAHLAERAMKEHGASPAAVL